MTKWYEENMNGAKNTIRLILEDQLPGSALEDVIEARFGKSNINWDVFDYEFGLKNPSKASVVAMDSTQIKIDCKNLYTFTLLCGRFVPYFDWVYEENFADPETGIIFSQKNYPDKIRHEAIVMTLPNSKHYENINYASVRKERDALAYTWNCMEENESRKINLKNGSVWFQKPENPF